MRFVEGFSRIFDLTLLSASGAGFTNTPGVEFKQVRLDVGRFGFVFRAARWLFANRSSYDLVFGLDTLTAAAACSIARVLKGKPTILVLLRPAVEYFRCRRLRGEGGMRYWGGLGLVRFLTAVNCRIADAVAPCSHHIASQVRSRRVEVIPSYGVDTDAYRSGLGRAEARRMVGLPLDVPIAFCRSRIGVEKDPETFLLAMKSLEGRGRHVEALYVGGEYREFLALARSLDIEVHARDHVHPLEDLPTFYAAADVAVQTSLSEGLGLSPLESACCGVPVVVSSTGGLLETIKDHTTGLTAPVRDHEAVADQIEWMLDHPEEGRRMAEEVRKLVERTYSADVAFAAWLQLAQVVAEARSKP